MFSSWHITYNNCASNLNEDVFSDSRTKLVILFPLIDPKLWPLRKWFVSQQILTIVLSLSALQALHIKQQDLVFAFNLFALFSF